MDDQNSLYLALRGLNGEASVEELQELDRIVKEDPLFKEKFELLKAYWVSKNNSNTNYDGVYAKVKERIKTLESVPEKYIESEINLSSKRNINYIVFSRRLLKIAAILILIAGGIYFFLNTTKSEREIVSSSTKKVEIKNWLVKENTKGRKSTIDLTDGTRVILNADSHFRYPHKFTGKTREVFLEGEAFFDVAKNPEIPFVIHTGKMNIKVLGTAFNVKSYPEDSVSETTLIRGLVEITLNNRPSDKIILRPNEKLIVYNHPDSAGIERTALNGPNDIRLTISTLNYVSATDSAIIETEWIHNRLVFRDESFGSLAKEMERRYGVNIHFLNESVGEYHFTGSFEKENIREALEALRLTEKFNYRIQNNEITIY